MSDDYVIDEGAEIANDAGTFRVLVLSDPYGLNPREQYDFHAGTMVAQARGYDLPQETGPGLYPGTVLAAIEDHSFRVVARWLRMFHGASVVLPLYDAGSRDVVLAPGSGAEGEDANAGNYLGVIYDSAQRWADLGVTAITREDVVKTLREEVRQYSTWSTGEMTAYRIDRTDNPGDDEVWQVWEGPYGGYYSVEEAREAAELSAVAANAQADHVTALHDEALAENEAREVTRLIAEQEAVAHEVVLDAAAEQGANAVNGGPDTMRDYLLGVGWSLGDIKAALTDES